VFQKGKNGKQAQKDINIISKELDWNLKPVCAAV